MNLWNKLKKPIFVLAPMADVTDAAFRKVIAKYGKPDVLWTEFVSCDGLYATRERQGMKDSENPLMQDLLFSKAEHPIVAQIFSSKPEMMKYGAKLVAELGFDGVDINMGCPDRSIEKQGAGSALIKSPELAVALIEAARDGVREAGKEIPVSVKTRLGYNKVDMTWIRSLLEAKPEVLTVHMRTRKEMSKVPAHFEYIPEIVSLRNEVSPETIFLINGDVLDIEDGKEKIAQYGGDGVMIGRGIFGNPWLFGGKIPSVDEKLAVMLEHTRAFEKLLPHKGFHIMKKHYKAYVSGFDGAAELRARLMGTNNADEVEEILKNK